MGLISPELIVKEMRAADVRWLAKPRRSIDMKQDSIEYRIRRKAELSDFMGASIDELVASMSLNRLFETQVKMMKAAEDLSEAGNRMIRGS